MAQRHPDFHLLAPQVGREGGDGALFVPEALVHTAPGTWLLPFETDVTFNPKLSLSPQPPAGIQGNHFSPVLSPNHQTLLPRTLRL